MQTSKTLAAWVRKQTSSLMGCIVLFGVPFSVVEFLVLSPRLQFGAPLFAWLAALLLVGASTGVVAWFVIFKPLHSRIATAKALVAQRDAAQQGVPADVARPAGERRG